MEMASEQPFMHGASSSTWHRPEPFASTSSMLGATGSDMSPNADSFYSRHHHPAAMDSSVNPHGGYFNSRAAAMHGFRSSAGRYLGMRMYVKRSSGLGSR